MNMVSLPKIATILKNPEGAADASAQSIQVYFRKEENS